VYNPAPATGVADNSTSGFRITEGKLLAIEVPKPEFELCDSLGKVAVPAPGPNGEEGVDEGEADFGWEKKYQIPSPTRTRMIRIISIVRIIFARLDMVLK
jgi:hypothetical protein